MGASTYSTPVEEEVKKTPEKLEKVTVHYGLFNGGDESAFVRWFLTAEEAKEAERAQSEPWDGDCTGSVETFIDSDIHQQAVKNKK